MVLDAPNIIYGGNEIPDGRRLLSAKIWSEKLGYTVEAVINRGTLRRFINPKKGQEPIQGSEALKSLLADGTLASTKEDDDKVILDKCTMRTKKAWIVTHDKFDDRKKVDGTVEPRQRSKYPDLPWDEIDKYTRGTQKYGNRIESGRHWRVEGIEFFDHEMPSAPKPVLLGKYARVRDLAEDLPGLLMQLDGELEILVYQNDDEKINLLRDDVKSILSNVNDFLDRIPEQEYALDDLLSLSTSELERLAIRKGLSEYVSGERRGLIQLLIEDSHMLGNQITKALTDPTKESADLRLVKEGLGSTHRSQTIAKTADIDPRIFFETMFSYMDDPNEWTDFHAPYEKMIESMPEFNLKRKGVVPFFYLKLHKDTYVDVGEIFGKIKIRKKQ